jgi:long-chain acyl-CoA synthetase
VATRTRLITPKLLATVRSSYSVDMTSINDPLSTPPFAPHFAPQFATLPDLIAQHARTAPERAALKCGEHSLTYAELDAEVNRVSSGLQRAGVLPGQAVALCATASLRYAAAFLGILRAGACVVPLPTSATPASLRAMLRDAQAKLLFADVEAHQSLGKTECPTVLLDGDTAALAWQTWLPPEGSTPLPVHIDPAAPFNLIYSSGTTGTPKGIVQPHAMRWAHIVRNMRYGYGPQSVTLVATPLYSNTTLVSFIPALALGGTVVLMPKFDALNYLQLAQQHRVTHSMLVPVQYQRLMAHPRFDEFDLSACEMKFCTSAHFSAALKADVLKRWPGGLVEFYGMTEGGGTCILEAHAYPSKLHTVGQAAPGSDLRLIDEAGMELPAEPGLTGEIVGHSGGMMTGYHGLPDATRQAEWFDTSGKRFIRTGDIGSFDGDGFLTLLDRKKDMVISGGFNVYPSDLEAVLMQHPAVLEAAVVGLPSDAWGETPVACVVLKAPFAGSELLAWVNGQVGKTQRLSALHLMAELPRSAIGKVLKRELRDHLLNRPANAAAATPTTPPA